MSLPPQHYAQAIRRKFQLTGPVDPFQIAVDLEVQVFEEKLDADGYLLKGNNQARIILNAGNPYESRKRFTLAHELGHYVMPHHDQEMFRCLSEDIQSFKSNKELEYEANVFASELLLPTNEVYSLLTRPPDLDLVKSIAEQYETSLLATAVKVAEVSSERVAVVLSSDGRVRWFAKSHSWPYWIRIGPLHQNCYAYDYYVSKELPMHPQSVLASAWCDGAHPNQEVLEESIAFPRLGSVLTLLHFPYSEEDEDAIELG